MGQRLPIYLDHHATTPVDPRVVEAMLPLFSEDFGNAASANHLFGWRAEAVVEDARERVAAAIGAEPREIIFTSGATESNCLAILGAARSALLRSPERRRDRIVTVATEHPAVLDPCRQLEREGFSLRYLPTGSAAAPGQADSGQDPLIAAFSVNLPLGKGKYRAARRQAAELHTATGEERLGVDEDPVVVPQQCARDAHSSFDAPACRSRDAEFMQ